MLYYSLIPRPSPCTHGGTCIHMCVQGEGLRTGLTSHSFSIVCGYVYSIHFEILCTYIHDIAIMNMKYQQMVPYIIHDTYYYGMYLVFRFSYVCFSTTPLTKCCTSYSSMLLYMHMTPKFITP